MATPHPLFPNTWAQSNKKLKTKGTSTQISSLLRLWLLRILVLLGGHQKLIKRDGFRNDSIAEAVGLGEWIDPGNGNFLPKVVRSQLRRLHQEAEKEKNRIQPPHLLKINVERLSKLVGLSSIDCRILEFAVLIHQERLLDETADMLEELSSSGVFHALSVLLDISEKEARDALSRQGILARSGLVTLDRSMDASLQCKLDILSNDFADHIISSDADPITFLRETVAQSAPAELSMADYSHMDKVLSILQPYLRKSMAEGRKGVNIFIHGEPGTGKTQFIRALAKELGRELFEIACEDSDGDPVEGESRLRSYGAAQTFFGQRCALILFDEAEDIFNDGNAFFGMQSTAEKHKAWVNRMLEENPVPAFWLSNSIDCMDPAFIRRFDMVFELPIPPKKQRKSIIQTTCSGLLGANSIVRLADSEKLAPAVIAKAASVVRSISSEFGEEEASSAVEFLVSNTLSSQGHKPILPHDPNRLPEIYDPAFVNADSDLASLAQGLVKARSGRLCLYGPPGTGKTAFGRWLAEQLAAPIVVKRASDLMSKWLGESEQKIAHAFRQAVQENAVLLIDEVDSFLQDRRGSRQSWEISMVNEMLVQMESYAGIFIASTNLVAGLDQAALRRFDLKVKFDFLKPEQAWELLHRHCESLDLPAPAPSLKARVDRLMKLTPGDYAAVVRQQRFKPIISVDELVAALEAECNLKEGPKAAIGFV